MLKHVPLHIDGEILNDEMVIIHPSGSAGEPEIFEPNTGVRLPGVPDDVGGRSDALWERCSLDTLTKGPWSRDIWAGTLVVWSATMPGLCVLALLNGQARACTACSRCHSIGVIIMPGLMPVADVAASVLVRTEPFTY